MSNTHVIYAYVDGSDLEDVAELLEARLDALVAAHRWASQVPRVVNQRHPPDPSVGPDDLPDWDLGLNLDVGPLCVTRHLLQDLATVVDALQAVYFATHRSFVLGVADASAGLTEDLIYVGPNVPGEKDLARLV